MIASTYRQANRSAAIRANLLTQQLDNTSFECFI